MSVPKLVAVERANAQLLLLDVQEKLLALGDSSGCEAGAERRYCDGVMHALEILLPGMMPDATSDYSYLTVLDLGHGPDCAARRIAFTASTCVCR